MQARILALALPFFLLPIVFASSAEASPSTNACSKGALGGIQSLHQGNHTSVTVSLLETGCTMQVISLVSYQTQGPDYNSAGTQTRFDLMTRTATAMPQTLAVVLPDCFFQVDLIYGSDAPLVLPDQGLYYTHHATLLGSYNGGSRSCAVTRTASPPTAPPTTLTSSPTVIDQQSGSTPPTEDVTVPPIAPVTTAISVEGARIPTTEKSASVEDVKLDFQDDTRLPANTIIPAQVLAHRAVGVLPLTGLQVFALLFVSLGLVIGGLAVKRFGRNEEGGTHH